MPEDLGAYYGGAGIIVVAGTWLAALVLRLQKLLQESQERRVADAQSTTAKILVLVDQHNTTQGNLAVALNANADAVRSLESRLYSAGPRRG